jgi:hypothetical protein
MFVYDDYIGSIPNITEDNFIDHLKQIVSSRKVDFIYPCMDVVLNKLKKHEEELGCVVLTSDHDTTEICSSKLKTYNFFKNKINTPKVLDNTKCLEFPVFSKPEIGASSRNTFKILDQKELESNIKKYPNNLILEYLPGDEYTVDCFTSKKGELKFVGARKRARISNGISVSTFQIQDEEIENIANKINSELKFNGAWFFQLKKDINGEYSLLEIACRFAGSSSIHRINGINFSYLNILNELYDDVQILNNNLPIKIDRSLDLKCRLDICYDSVYIDFDDTIIVNNKVNCDMISFIYSQKNKNKKIILLTKHKFDIFETLRSYCIDKNLFDEIIKIDKSDEKYKYVNDHTSIFIDDSFSERSSVHKKLNIPVFSVDCVKSLI